ncbi:hypothetical protein WH47_11031, partial [Habropoda laboriosa]
TRKKVKDVGWNVLPHPYRPDLVSLRLSHIFVYLRAQCVENCSGKHIHANHKIMEIFMEVQPVIARKNMEELQKTQAALEITQEQQSLVNTT